MKRIIIACACLAVCCSAASAETIMVSLLNDAGVEYFGGEQTRLASALVEGAMEIFFKADHIVFDLGLPREDREILPDRETAASIARAGGAGYILDLRIGAPDGDSGPPEYVLYDFIDLADDRVIASGTIKRTAVNAKVSDSLSICLLLGEMSAAEALLALE